MPGTASKETVTRSTPSSRHSANLRPRASDHLAPVLLRFPVVQQLGDSSPSKPTSPSEIVASSVVPLDPPVTAATPAMGSAQQPSTPSLAIQPEASDKTKQVRVRSWWEHWSSGVVLMILLVALIVTAMMVMNNRRFGEAGTVASDGKQPTEATKTGEDLSTLSGITIPEISLGAPASNVAAPPAGAASVVPKKPEVEATNASPAPFSQVSARVNGGDSLKEASATTLPPSTGEKQEGKPTSAIQIGLPSPMESASNSVPAANSNNNSGLGLWSLSPSPASKGDSGPSTTVPAAPPRNSPTSNLQGKQVASPNAMGAEAGPGSLQLSSLSRPTAQPAPQGSNAEPKLPDLLAPPGGAQKVPANLTGYSVTAPKAGAINSVVLGEPAINPRPDTSSNVGGGMPGPADIQTQVAGPVASTATPDLDVDQVVKQWREFAALRNASRQAEVNNRYHQATGGVSGPASAAPGQPAGNPER